ncbi:hypothetical protein LCGC14_1588330 [marine sediment metagenome]|uniref:Uncharacterized protein n=1 Tax=marine sediment metagenome TaxID=412755 RepID=A0A0F8Y2F0_9ZZZZ
MELEMNPEEYADILETFGSKGDRNEYTRDN